MKLEVIIFVIVFLFPLITFMSYGGFLATKRGKTLFLGISGLLFLIGMVLFFVFENKLSIVAIVPLFFFLNYIIMTRLFIKIYKRPPADTTYNWESGLLTDRIYNILVVLIGTALPIVLLALLN